MAAGLLSDLETRLCWMLPNERDLEESRTGQLLGAEITTHQRTTALDAHSASHHRVRREVTRVALPGLSPYPHRNSLT